MNRAGKRLSRIESLERRTLLAGDIELIRYFDTWEGNVPSTDAAGLTFHAPSGRLYLTDSEINEIPSFFTGENIFEISLRGNQTYQGFVSGNKEPTGITYSEFDGFFYVTSDNGDGFLTRYDDGLDAPRKVISPHDDVSNATDPEGVTSDPSNGRLYVVDGDGGGIQVLVYNASMNYLYRFSLANRLNDAEGIALHPESGTLFIIDGTQRTIFEYTVDGEYLEQYDLSDFSTVPRRAKGLTFAPTSSTSDDPEALALYIADAGVDNFPDGRIFETRVVPAGSDDDEDEDDDEDDDDDDDDDEEIDDFMNGSVNATVDRSSDDAQQLVSGEMLLSERSITLENQGWIGFRFDDLEIPQGATITRAYLKFKSLSDGTGNIRAKLRAHDTDDASTFRSSDSDLSSRSSTDARVKWDIPQWQKKEYSDNQKSDDLSPIIQEIVDRSGWESGNAIALIAKMKYAGSRTIKAFDRGGGKLPTLYIEYTTGGSSSSSRSRQAGLQETIAIDARAAALFQSDNDSDWPVKPLADNVPTTSGSQSFIEIIRNVEIGLFESPLGADRISRTQNQSAEPAFSDQAIAEFETGRVVDGYFEMLGR